MPIFPPVTAPEAAELLTALNEELPSSIAATRHDAAVMKLRRDAESGVVGQRRVDRSVLSPSRPD
ncbi:hypothetical protein [Nocardia sp. MW-W600-9]